MTPTQSFISACAVLSISLDDFYSRRKSNHTVHRRTAILLHLRAPPHSLSYSSLAAVTGLRRNRCLYLISRHSTSPAVLTLLQSLESARAQDRVHNQEVVAPGAHDHRPSQ